MGQILSMSVYICVSVYESRTTRIKIHNNPIFEKVWNVPYYDRRLSVINQNSFFISQNNVPAKSFHLKTKWNKTYGLQIEARFSRFVKWTAKCNLDWMWYHFSLDDAYTKILLVFHPTPGDKPMTFPYWSGAVTTELFMESFVVFWFMTFYSCSRPSVRSAVLFHSIFCRIS